MKRKARSVTPALLRGWPLPSLAGGEGKEHRGRVLAVGGSRTVPGALLLSGVAALRVGAGKLQLATVADAAIGLGLHVPEALVMGLPTTRGGEVARTDARLDAAAVDTDALLVGPGMLPGPSTERVARRLIARTCAPVVLDAGAMSACLYPTKAGRDPVVVTPHCGEMAGLLGIDADEVASDAERTAQAFADAHDAVVVLKGATTWIAAPDGERWAHTGGCIGLGTSGSGDVLAGAIAGLMARGATPEQAAVWAVWLHGRAGEMLARRMGPVGFLAREIPAELPGLLPR